VEDRPTSPEASAKFQQDYVEKVNMTLQTSDQSIYLIPRTVSAACYLRPSSDKKEEQFCGHG